MKFIIILNFKNFNKGILKKEGKNYSIIGCTLNYGLSNTSVYVKIDLDIEKGSLIIHTPSQPQGEIYHNLPSGPLIPAFQNKTNKKSNCFLRMQVWFEGTTAKII